MHKVVVLYPQPEDAAAFRDYYVSTHLPLALKLPGMLAARYSFDVAAADGGPGFFAVFEAEFADGAAFGAAMQSPEGAAVGADVANYSPKGATIIHYPVETLK